MQEAVAGSKLDHSVRMRRMFSVALLIVVAIAGARGTAIPPGARDVGPGVLLVPFGFGLLAAGWCHFDGRIRGKPPTRIALMAIVLVAAIAVPVYCVWSRGIRGVLLLLGSAVALSISALIGAGIAVLALGNLHG